MSGRKQFNEDQALEAAMRAFWENGYEATSLSDLEGATGLNKSSLYNAFESKEALFVRCLERYAERVAKPLAWELKKPEFRAAITGFFDRLISRFDDPGAPPGCLATMAAMELGQSAGMSAGLVCANLEAQRDAFEARCRQAVADGELAADTDCGALAAMLVSISRGLAVLNRAEGNSALARQAVAGLLNQMMPAGAQRPQ